MPKAKPMTKAGFRAWDIVRSSLTAEQYDRMLKIVRCTCGAFCCRGWITEPRNGIKKLKRS